jgi:bacterioferritin
MGPCIEPTELPYGDVAGVRRGEASMDRARTGERVISIEEEPAMATTMEELLEGLNLDLAAEFQAVITYRLFASLCSGPYRQEIRNFFEEEIPDELGHAEFLADKIVALGGMPTTDPLPVQLTADNREMFEIALQAETDTIARYEERVRQADALGLTALKVRLEDLIVDETGHKEEIERRLHTWKG